MTRSEHTDKWRKKNPEKYQAQNAKKRAKYHANKHEILANQAAKTYGITVEQYREMISRPCAICGNREPMGRTGCGMHVDHDHATGRVRGTLCHRCNRALGLLKENVETMQAMIDYIRSA